MTSARARADAGLQEAMEKLGAQLHRYPAQRYPVQHATAQFHRGHVLIDLGRWADAASALASSVRLFDGMALEQAKARNMLGVALRLDGRAEHAIEAFQEAGAVFEREHQPLEEAAARFNCGLAQAEAGLTAAARPSFERARQLFEHHGAPRQAAAAGRELGATLLAAGGTETAIAVLEEAVAAAARAGDQAGRGAAANALGLACLAAGHPQQAADALREAVAAHPRSVRPESYTMAKANLALAYETAGEAARARLAAAQVLGTPGATEPVRTQASAVLARLGWRDDDLPSVLDEEPAERWGAVLREEALRWADADVPTQRGAAAAWIDAVLARPGRAVGWIEAWLGVLLELPPAAMEIAVRATVAALGDRDDGGGQQFSGYTSRAMARFNVPQWMRVKDAFSRAAADFGQPRSWG